VSVCVGVRHKERMSGFERVCECDGVCVYLYMSEINIKIESACVSVYVCM
jgi:hypothetical protein